MCRLAWCPRTGVPTPHAPWLPLPVAARPLAASCGRPTPHTRPPAVALTRTDPPASWQPRAAPHPGGGARRTRATRTALPTATVRLRHSDGPQRRGTSGSHCRQLGWTAPPAGGSRPPRRPTPMRTAVPPDRHLRGGRARRARPPVRCPPDQPLAHVPDPTNSDRQTHWAPIAAPAPRMLPWCARRIQRVVLRARRPKAAPGPGKDRRRRDGEFRCTDGGTTAARGTGGRHGASLGRWARPKTRFGFYGWRPRLRGSRARR